MSNQLGKSLFFLLLFAIIIPLLNSCQGRISDNQIPKVEKGVIDLRNWDFQKNGVVNLKGQWEFYWGKHILPSESAGKASGSASGFINVPGIWNNFINNGEKISGHGFATYRLRVLAGENRQLLGFKLLDMSSAFRVYVNGDLLVSTGIPGETAQQTTPSYSPGVAAFENISEEFDVIIHVSNFDHCQGGMWEPVFLGKPSQLNSMRERQLVISSFLFGTICIMGFYHLGLFWSRRKDKSTLYFGVFCLLIALRIITHEEMYITTFFSAMGYGLHTKLIYLSFYVSVPCFGMYIRSIFPEEMSGKVTSFVIITCLAFSSVVLFADVVFYTRTLFFFQLLTLLLLIYGIIVVFHAILRKRQGAFVFLFGFLSLLVTTVNDVLFARMIIETGYWVPFGLFVFIFCQAFIISRRFSSAFMQVEKQGKELKQEISEKQKIENNLKKSEEKYRQMIDFLPIPVTEYDFDLNIKYVNNAALDRFGYTREEIKPETKVSNLISKEADLKLTMHMEKLTNSENPSPLELHLLKKDGSKVWGQVTPSLIFKNNQPVGIRTCFVDLTENKKAENALVYAAQQEKYALVGQVAGKMAHDFNNILGIIMGNTELSLIDCQDGEIRKTLELIFEQTLRGKNLTKNLVAFAKDQELKQEFFNISEKTDLVIDLLKKDLEGVKFIKEYASDVPELLADSGMIEHALVNIVLNSMHALSLTKHPLIIIRTYCQDKYICIEIEDNGCGIPGEHMENIFEPSFTLKGSRDTRGSYKTDIKGTGYGLANVKRYMQKHKGEISVASEVDSGTKVKIRLPVIEKELTNSEITELKNSRLQFEKSILLVEDEPAISDVQYRTLTQHPLNHKVDIANNGKAAIDFFNMKKYDFVSLDYILPGNFNGMDVYNHIRKTDKAVPILFVSGNIEFLESIKALKQKDANLDNISKPCQNKDYINSINNLLEKTQVEDQECYA